MTEEEGEFQGEAIHAEELTASSACRDETTDLGPVPIAPLLTIVYEQILEALDFLGCRNSVGAKFIFALFFQFILTFWNRLFCQLNPLSIVPVAWKVSPKTGKN